MPQSKRAEPERRPTITATQRTEPERRPTITATQRSQQEDLTNKKERAES